MLSVRQHPGFPNVNVRMCGYRFQQNPVMLQQSLYGFRLEQIRIVCECAADSLRPVHNGPIPGFIEMDVDVVNSSPRIHIYRSYYPGCTCDSGKIFELEDDMRKGASAEIALWTQ